MGNEFIGEHRGVDFDFDEIDGHGWDFSKDSSAERVREGEVYVVKREVDAVRGNLAPLISLQINMFKKDSIPRELSLEVPPHQRPYCRSPW